MIGDISGAPMRPVDAKRREATFQRWCGEILRETRDRRSLAWISARALNDSDVVADPELAGRLRGFVAEREAELRLMEAEYQSRPPSYAPSAPRAEPHAPTQAQVRVAYQRLLHALEDDIAHFDEARAQEELGELDAMQKRYANWLDPAAVASSRKAVERLARRREALIADIETLARRACEAARRGKGEAAAADLRKLSSIHAARPRLLTEARFAEIREEIAHGGQEHEHREAARRLIERERAVAGEIRKLADVVHRFHLVASRVPPDSATYQQAEFAYREAVKTVRSHDQEWLAELILELDAFLDEMHGEKAARQVDRFLASVRRAHRQLIDEIREIHRELH
jgi:hypothetical protein